MSNLSDPDELSESPPPSADPPACRG